MLCLRGCKPSQRHMVSPWFLRCLLKSHVSRNRVEQEGIGR